MKTKLCNHRYEITYTFTDVGYGFTEEQAIDDCIESLLQTPMHDLIDWLKVNNMEKDTSVDTCYLCDEKE